MVFGRSQYGAQRWIQIGPVQLQPAEFVKLSTVMLLASVFADHKAWPKKFPQQYSVQWWLDHGIWTKLRRALPVILVGATMLLIDKEKDLGTASVIGVILLGMMWFGGTSKKSILLLIAFMAVSSVVLVKVQPYRMSRITTFMSRWNADDIDGAGLQSANSELAMASAGVGGVGIGSGRAKHVLPSTTITTDFIMATVAEETGLVGALLVLALLGSIALRLFTLASKATTKFGSLVCYGVAIWISVQGCVNMMMANATLPAIGIPFPFVSYGGSSLISLWIAIGLCQSSLMPEPVKEKSNAPSRNRRRNWWSRLSGA